MTPFDLTAQLDALRRGLSSAETLFTQNIMQARGDAARAAFVRLDDSSGRAAAQAADTARAQGRPAGALGGLAVSVKDLFDVQGQITRAGSRVLADAPATAQDAPAVARLRAAGAALIGRTQMTEFAFSGVGINPHDGTPANAALHALDPAVARVPGGSTSGGAVSVAAGAAWAALGTDTGGSIRIPAALHGLVGYKNTARLVPLAGSVPLAPSLDTVCAITHSVRDAVLLHEVLAARRVSLAERPLRDWRFGIARPLMQDQLDPEVAAAFEQALQTLGAAGAQLQELGLPALSRVGELQVGGGITAAEAWAWHQPLLERHEAHYDPRVATRIRRGAAISAAQLTELHQLRQRWIADMAAELAPVDLVLSPTVPLIAPPLAPLLHDDEAFFRVNALLLRNTAPVNLLDGCALSLPCQAPGRAPVGLMLWGCGGQDDALLAAALAVEAALNQAGAA
ncbi:MAG: hypothetical protein RLY71_3807 [Pseudomonadota bacterium]